MRIIKIIIKIIMKIIKIKMKKIIKQEALNPSRGEEGGSEVQKVDVD